VPKAVEDTTEQREQAEFDAFIDALNASEAAEMTPSEVAGGDKKPGVQDGGIRISVVAPGASQTLVRGDSLHDPRDNPPPTIYGEELCAADAVRGQFEPAQGVWQDDPTFEDRPGKQLYRLSPRLFRAELPMVTGRSTLFFGVERAVGGAEPRRDEIFIKGEATGTVALPVKFRFTLKQAGGEEELYMSPVMGEVPLGGECGTHTSFEVKLPAPDGRPQDGWFRIKEDGEYIIEAELVTEDDKPTGIKVAVMGEAVSTQAPTLAFRPVGILSSSLRAERRSRLEEDARRLERRSRVVIPDFLPVVDEPLITHLFPLLNRGDLLDLGTARGRRKSVSAVVEQLGSELVQAFLSDMIREELIRELQVGGLMSGFDRIVVLMTGSDFDLVYQGSLEFNREAVGFADSGSRKLLFINIDQAGDPWSVAHEVIHTLPWDWSDGEVKWMSAECALHYHGVADGIAHGHQITQEGAPHRSRRDGSLPVMGSQGEDKWITQCTYRHLIQVLSAGIPDPRVVLVQGFVARHDGRTAGVFLPFYDLDGFVDLPPDGTGIWAIVLRDAAGDVLARHAWEPQWRIPDVDVERPLMAFAFRLPWIEGIARVDLEGPEGLLDSRSLSTTAPSVTIVSPAEGAATPLENGGIRVDWSGSDADGDSLLYTVLYSSDGGTRWMDVAVETEETSVLVPIEPDAPHDAHRVLVRATDGGRSADAARTLQPANGGP
jgi:hypothetical protein